MERTPLRELQVPAGARARTLVLAMGWRHRLPMVCGQAERTWVVRPRQVPGWVAPTQAVARRVRPLRMRLPMG